MRKSWESSIAFLAFFCHCVIYYSWYAKSKKRRGKKKMSNVAVWKKRVPRVDIFLEIWVSHGGGWIAGDYFKDEGASGIMEKYLRFSSESHWQHKRCECKHVKGEGESFLGTKNFASFSKLKVFLPHLFVLLLFLVSLFSAVKKMCCWFFFHHSFSFRHQAKESSHPEEKLQGVLQKQLY